MAADKNDKSHERGDSDTFLSTVDAKIAALQALRASYVAARSVGAFGPGADASAFVSATGMGGQAMELPRGAMLGKSIPAAIKLYLSAIKRKQTLREIANALRDGGVESTAKNFETPVQSAIYRLQTAGEVLRFKDGWALAEFYPEQLRNRIAEKDARPKKNGKKRGRSTAKRPPAPKEKAAATTAKPSDDDAGGMAARVVSFLRQRGKPATAAEVASALGSPPNVIGLTLGRLKVMGRVSKDADGLFSLAS